MFKDDGGKGGADNEEEEEEAPVKLGLNPAFPNPLLLSADPSFFFIPSADVVVGDEEAVEVVAAPKGFVAVGDFGFDVLVVVVVAAVEEEVVEVVTATAAEPPCSGPSSPFIL